MQRHCPAALLELQPEPQGHGSLRPTFRSERRCVVRSRRVPAAKSATRRKVAIDAYDARGGANNELLTALRINRLFVWPHGGIGIALMCECENWHERPRVLLVIEQLPPVVRPQAHATREAFRPIIAARDAIVILQQKGHENVARTRGDLR